MNTINSMTADSLHQVDIPVGAHLVTPRRGYMHHGIYVGGGEVVHYTGLANALRRGPVAKETLASFAAGNSISIRFETGAAYAPFEVAARAQSRLGEDRYSLLNNNCEHFCAWCVHGVARSAQVDRFLAWPRRFATVVRSWFEGSDLPNAQAA
jgi:hypothetical protein